MLSKYALCLIILISTAAGPAVARFQFLNIQPYTKNNTSNFTVYPKSTVPEPSKGTVVSDPWYGGELIKVADKTEFPAGQIANAVRPVYSRWRIENSDGSKYFLLKDGETPTGSGKGQTVIYNSADDSLYKIITEVNSGEPKEFRWDYSGNRPNTMYYVSGSAFYEYDIVTGQSALIRDFAADFPGCARILNDVEGDSSGDSRYWAFMVQSAYNGSSYPMLAIITYDKQTDTILGTLDYATYAAAGGAASVLPTPNMVDISPLGTKVILLYGKSWGAVVTIPGPWTDEGGGIWSAPYQAFTAGNNAFNWVKVDGVSLTKQSPITGDGQWTNVSALNKLYLRLAGGESPQAHTVTLEYGKRPDDLGTIFDGPHAFDFDFTHPVKISNDETHGGWAFDLNGDEVYICQINAGNWANADADTLAFTNITTGETKVIMYHADIGWDVGGWHFGRFYDRNIRGWAYMTSASNYATSNSWMRNQAVMIELKSFDQHPRVWRITDTHNNYPNTNGYAREAYSPITRDGKYIFWGSDWPGGDGTVDTYKMELPDNWWLSLNGIPPSTTAVPPGGTYTSPQTVRLSALGGTTIYYTLDGSSPTTSSAVYAAPLEIQGPATLKFFAVDIVGNREPVQTQVYLQPGPGVNDIIPPVTTSLPASNENAVAYPVPFVGNTHAQITFTNIVPGSTLDIYTIDGQLFASVEVSDTSYSFVPNELASGTYLYVINGSGGTKRGKFVVIK